MFFVAVKMRKIGAIHGFKDLGIVQTIKRRTLILILFLVSIVIFLVIVVATKLMSMIKLANTQAW